MVLDLSRTLDNENSDLGRRFERISFFPLPTNSYSFLFFKLTKKRKKRTEAMRRVNDQRERSHRESSFYKGRIDKRDTHSTERQARDLTPFVFHARTQNLTLDRIPLPPESVIADPPPPSSSSSSPLPNFISLFPLGRNTRRSSIAKRRGGEGGGGRKREREFGLEAESGRESVAPIREGTLYQ